MPKPYSWKTTQKKVPYSHKANDQEPMAPLEKPAPVVPKMLYHLMNTTRGADVNAHSEFYVTYHEADYRGQLDRAALSEMVAELNRNEMSLRQAMDADDMVSIPRILENSRHHLDGFFNQPRDLNDPMVAQLYHLHEKINLANAIVPLNDELSTGDNSLHEKCSDLLRKKDYNVLENGPEPVDDLYDTQVQNTNFALDQLQDILDTAYEQQGSGLTPEEFEKEYYKKYQHYKEDKIAYQSFRSALHSGLEAGESSVLLRNLVDNGDTNRILFNLDDKTAIIAILKDPAHLPKSPESLSIRKDEIENTMSEDEINDSFEKLYINQIKNLRSSIDSAESKYSFNLWEKASQKQKKSLNDLYTYQEKGLTDNLHSLTDTFFSNERHGQTRPFYRRVNAYLGGMISEFNTISTKSLGRSNSDEFNEMQEAFDSLSSFAMFNSTYFGEAEKNAFLGHLQTLGQKAEAYIRAKKAQKGINDDSDPHFRTEQGKKRYELAKKLQTMSRKMESLMNCAEENVVNNDTILKNMHEEFEGDGLMDKLAAYRSSANSFDIPGQVQKSQKVYLAKKYQLKNAIYTMKSENAKLDEKLTPEMREEESIKYAHMARQARHSKTALRLSAAENQKLEDKDTDFNALYRETSDSLAKQGLSQFKPDPEEHKSVIELLQKETAVHNKIKTPKNTLAAKKSGPTGPVNGNS